MGGGDVAQAAAYVEAIVRVGDEDRTVWGVGIAPSITSTRTRAA